MINIFKGYLEKYKYKVWILDGYGEDKVEVLYKEIKDLLNVVECILVGIIGFVFGVNIGFGLVGFVIEKVDWIWVVNWIFKV